MDGTRAGYFEANTNNLAAWPRWTIEALFLHEAVPGHHLQIARGQEIAGLPALRRSNGNYAFHNAVIDHGSLPLPVLRQVIGEWIDAQHG
jgi:uncharacterized protein (DUF885 family)